MSRSDWGCDRENKRSLLPVFIEIGRGLEPAPLETTPVNVSTFRKCFLYIHHPRSPEGPVYLGDWSKVYSIYSVAAPC